MRWFQSTILQTVNWNADDRVAVGTLYILYGFWATVSIVPTIVFGNWHRLIELAWTSVRLTVAEYNARNFDSFGWPLGESRRRG